MKTNIPKQNFSMWPMDLVTVDTETKLENVAVLETHVKKAKAIVTMITSAKKVWYAEVIIAVGISFGIQRIVVKRKVLLFLFKDWVNVHT